MKRVAIALQHCPAQFDLLGNLYVVFAQHESVTRRGGDDLIAFLQLELREEFLGKNESGAGADTKLAGQ